MGHDGIPEKKESSEERAWDSHSLLKNGFSPLMHKEPYVDTQFT